MNFVRSDAGKCSYPSSARPPVHRSLACAWVCAQSVPMRCRARVCVFLMVWACARCSQCNVCVSVSSIHLNSLHSSQSHSSCGRRNSTRPPARSPIDCHCHHPFILGCSLAATQRRPFPWTAGLSQLASATTRNIIITIIVAVSIVLLSTSWPLHPFDTSPICTPSKED